MTSRLSISRAWDQTREVVRRDGRLMFAVALALLVLPQTLLGAFTPTSPTEATPTFQILLVIAVATAIAAQIALNRLAIPPSATVAEGVRRGITRTPATFFSLMLVFFIASLLLMILLVILVMVGALTAPVSGKPPSIGFIALVLAGLLGVFVIFQLTVPIAAAEAGGPLYLIQRSWTLGKKHYWRLAAFLLLVLIGMGLIWLSAQVIAGLIFTTLLGRPESGSIAVVLISLVVAAAQAAWTIVSSVMLARVYSQVAGSDAEASVPSTGD